MINKVIEKGYRNKPLTEKQIADNKEKSRTRVRVEQIFGFTQSDCVYQFVIRCIDDIIAYTHSLAVIAKTEIMSLKLSIEY